MTSALAKIKKLLVGFLLVEFNEPWGLVDQVCLESEGVVVLQLAEREVMFCITIRYCSNF